MDTQDKAKDKAMCHVQAALRLVAQEITPCPRSPEWKRGARDAICKVFGVPREGNPYACGTAQDDAWRAGFHVGHVLAGEAMAAAA